MVGYLRLNYLSPTPRALPASAAAHFSSPPGFLVFSFAAGRFRAAPSACNLVRRFVGLRESQAMEGDAVADPKASLKMRLEEFKWNHSFVRELPGDPRTDDQTREV